MNSDSTTQDFKAFTVTLPNSLVMLKFVQNYLIELTSGGNPAYAITTTGTTLDIYDIDLNKKWVTIEHPQIASFLAGRLGVLKFGDIDKTADERLKVEFKVYPVDREEDDNCSEEYEDTSSESQHTASRIKVSIPSSLNNLKFVQAQLVAKMSGESLTYTCKNIGNTIYVYDEDFYEELTSFNSREIARVLSGNIGVLGIDDVEMGDNNINVEFLILPVVQ